MSRKVFADGENIPTGDSIPMTQLLDEPKSGIETAGPEALKKGGAADLESFMKELVTVAISPKGEGPYEVDAFPVNVNGRGYVLEKGKTYELPRFIVEVLLRGRTTTFSQRQYGMQPDQIELVEHRAQTYAMVVSGDSAEGFAWARRVQAAQA